MMASDEDALRRSSIGLRKQLPLIPSGSYLQHGQTSSTPLSRQLSNPCIDHGYGPFFLEYSLMTE